MRQRVWLLLVATLCIFAGVPLLLVWRLADEGKCAMRACHCGC